LRDGREQKSGGVLSVEVFEARSLTILYPVPSQPFWLVTVITTSAGFHSWSRAGWRLIDASVMALRAIGHPVADIAS
jgi:hypothetical protein